MSPVRTLAILPLAAALILSAAGCKQRGASTAYYDPNDAYSQQSSNEAAMWKSKYEQLLDERRKDTGGTVGEVAGGLGVTGIEGFTSSNGRVSLGEDFAFERGSDRLNSEGRKAIEKLALLLNDGDHAAQNVIVEGHTDDKPVSRPGSVDKYTDNWGLSALRSASVVRALQKAGIKPERLRGAFRGPYAPVVQGGKDDKNKDGNSANRRVEIFLSK
ncbi:MAG: OmpA family protein [Planctomycetota bacterium]